jgi:hypothetical protein
MRNPITTAPKPNRAHLLLRIFGICFMLIADFLIALTIFAIAPHMQASLKEFGPATASGQIYTVSHHAIAFLIVLLATQAALLLAAWRARWPGRSVLYIGLGFLAFALAMFGMIAMQGLKSIFDAMQSLSGSGSAP